MFDLERGPGQQQTADQLREKFFILRLKGLGSGFGGFSVKGSI